MSAVERDPAIPDVNLSIVAENAQLVAEALAAGETDIECCFGPGDATEYRFTLSKPRRLITSGNVSEYRLVGPGELVVAMHTPAQRVHHWGPANAPTTDHHYVMDHWSLEPYTARVLAAFLNMLRDALAEIAGVTL